MILIFSVSENDIFHNPVLSKIGAKYGKSVAQVITRWLIERDIIVLIGSSCTTVHHRRWARARDSSRISGSATGNEALMPPG